jgi:RNA polymerase sigma-70 factor (ECF subfamily)
MDRAPLGHRQSVALPATAAVVEELDFTTLYEQHFNFVWRCARRLGVVDALLDDAVQDVFVVVHRRLADFEGRSSVKSWIFGITRRVAKDYRRRAARKDRGKVPVEGLIAVGEASPADLAQQAEARALLHQILESLDDQKREVFVLAELEEMTVPEIADAISANVNTVYSRLRAARRAFEQQISRLLARERRHDHD